MCVCVFLLLSPFDFDFCTQYFYFSRGSEHTYFLVRIVTVLFAFVACAQNCLEQKAETIAQRKFAGGERLRLLPDIQDHARNTHATHSPAFVALWGIPGGGGSATFIVRLMHRNVCRVQVSDRAATKLTCGVLPVFIYF